MSTRIVRVRKPTEPPHHFGHGLGVGLGVVAWCVDVKEALDAIIPPFGDCDSFWSVVRTLYEMPAATAAGEAFWVVELGASTWLLIDYVFRRRR